MASASDTFAIGTIAGTVATIVMHLLSLAGVWLGLSTLTTMQVSSLIFLSPGQADTLFGSIVGGLVHLMIGAAGGIILAYFIRFSGKDYWWLKGLGLSGLMLLSGMGFILRLTDVAPQLRISASTTLVHITALFVYGLIAAFVIERYAQFQGVES